MNKFLIILNLALLLGIHSLTGQPLIKTKNLEALDYLIKYDLIFQEDSTNNQFLITEPMILLVVDEISSFLSNNKFRRDSVSQRITNQAEFSAFLQTYHHNNPMPRVFYTIYKNFPKGKITYYGMLFPERFHYIENYKAFRWTIHDQLKDLHGYKLQKATTRYGGRDWIAWFAPEIPLSEGPYKFAGLPGLIVEIYDTQNHYRFELTSMVKPSENEFISIPADMSSKEISRKQFNEAWQRFLQNPEAAMGSMIISESPEIRSRRMQIRRNTPIELPAD